MRSTRPRRCPDRDPSGAPTPSPSFAARHRAGVPSALLAPTALLALTAFLAGCSITAHVHPQYEQLRPSVVDLRRPENLTVIPLHSLTFGKLLQRLITGPRVYDVPRMLADGLRRALEERGYVVTLDLSRGGWPGSGDSGEPFPRPTRPEELPYDAVLVTAIEAWTQSETNRIEVRMVLDVELHDVRTGDVLYRVDDLVISFGGQSTEASDGRFLEAGLRKAGWTALSSLPRREGS